MIETPDFIPNFNAYQNLHYFSIQRGVTNKEKIENILAQVGLKNVTKKIRQYSLGMKQRLGIALALLTGPDLLVLDEPINGLDAEGIKEFRDLILKLNKEQGITILISSHILNELQQLAYRFVFIEDGKIIEDISKEQLLNKGKQQLIVKVDSPDDAVRILEQNIDNIKYKVLHNKTIAIDPSRVESSYINKLLLNNDVAVEEFKMETTNLEDYFLSKGEVIMINYIKSELYRVFHSKGIYIYIIVCNLLMLLAAVILFYFDKIEPTFPYGNAKFFYVNVVTAGLLIMVIGASMNMLVNSKQNKALNKISISF